MSDYEEIQKAAAEAKAAGMTPNDIALSWWANNIVLAVEDADEESRAQLAAATGDPEAWTAFAAVAMGEDDSEPEQHWEEFLAYVAEDPDRVDRSRLAARSASGYDPILDRTAQLALRLVRGVLAGNPAALPR